MKKISHMKNRIDDTRLAPSSGGDDCFQEEEVIMFEHLRLTASTLPALVAVTSDRQVLENLV